MSQLEKHLNLVPTEELARFIESSDPVLDALSVLPLNDIDYEFYQHLSDCMRVVYRHYCQRQDIRLLDFSK